MRTIASTTWQTVETMRHIPDEELHAYLDQALSRAQCVEIESHLASCAGCSDSRDGIAALRDRTTALLATLAPPRRFPPILDELREEAAARTARRHHTRRTAVWAASVSAALALGWGANAYVSRTHAAAVAPASIAANGPRMPAASAAPAGGRSAVSHAATPDDSAPRAMSVTNAAGREPPLPPPARAPLVIEPPRTEVSTARLPSAEADAALGGIWRTLSWAGARDERGDSVPHLDGLPVVEVQVGPAKTGGNKSIMVVAQQLKSGEVIRTIEGPASDVSQLLANRPGAASPSPWPTLESAGIAGGDGAMAMRHGDRMLAITAQLPNDSLRAMMRRLNAEMRQK
jgi:hypothetical protein